MWFAWLLLVEGVLRAGPALGNVHAHLLPSPTQAWEHALTARRWSQGQLWALPLWTGSDTCALGASRGFGPRPQGGGQMCTGAALVRGPEAAQNGASKQERLNSARLRRSERKRTARGGEAGQQWGTRGRRPRHSAGSGPHQRCDLAQVGNLSEPPPPSLAGKGD